jgi:predicted outer membrane protein
MTTPQNSANSGGSSPQAAVPAADLSLSPNQFGPLSAADKKLLALVRETSLREITTSQMALQKSSDPRIRQAAQMIISQHVVLNQKDLEAAQKLGLQLPNEPAPDMQVGIDRMKTENGKEFEDDYTNTLRQAHGEALILLSKVRADTQNSVVRPFAELASGFILMHIQMLEKTGQVNWGKLPVPNPEAP